MPTWCFLNVSNLDNSSLGIDDLYTRVSVMEGGVHYFNSNVKLFFPFVFTAQYKQNPEMFKQTARLWSHVYAGAPVSSPEYTRKIDKLCAMGFEKVSVSKSCLSCFESRCETLAE